MKKSITIVGAGIAGLLAANLLQRKGRQVRVIEAQDHLPNNHSAILRFRTSAVGDALGIPFRKVRLVKATVPWRNPVADAMAYAEKVSGQLRSDRSIPLQTETVDRWIAPEDLIPRMAEGVDVAYGLPWNFSLKGREKVISTIPMPTLATAIGHVWSDRVNFEWVSGWNVLARVRHCDAHVTLYVPNPQWDFSRVSITGDQMIVEVPNFPGTDEDAEQHRETWADHAATLFGIGRRHEDVRLVRQDYAKILPIPEGERRRFVYETSTVRQIAFSLGRFATWRPTLLADDLVKDIRIIESMIDSASAGYDAERREREIAK